MRTIIQLAHNLGIQPLAEGIETLAQRRFLVEHGCLLGQGFHFSKPVPADADPGALPPALRPPRGLTSLSQFSTPVTTIDRCSPRVIANAI